MHHLNFSFEFFLAAHCILDKNLEPNNVTALFGRLNITNNFEKDWTRRGISAFKMHKNYRNNNNAKADSDIALLILDQPVEFTKYIKPICLPKSNQDVPEKGTIIGYGKISSESEIQSIPLYAELETIDWKKCNQSNQEAPDIVALNCFCAKNSTHESYACSGILF